MPDLLQAGSRWLEQRRTEHCTQDVVYIRGSDSVTVKATIGRTRYETNDDQTVRVDFTDRDFLILAADLVLGGVNVTPKPGDRVRETHGAQTLVFEVIDWRYSDPYRQTLRIATKYIGSTNP